MTRLRFVLCVLAFVMACDDSAPDAAGGRSDLGGRASHWHVRRSLARL